VLDLLAAHRTGRDSRRRERLARRRARRRRRARAGLPRPPADDRAVQAGDLLSGGRRRPAASLARRRGRRAHRRLPALLVRDARSRDVPRRGRDIADRRPGRPPRARRRGAPGDGVPGGRAGAARRHDARVPPLRGAADRDPPAPRPPAAIDRARTARDPRPARHAPGARRADQDAPGDRADPGRHRSGRPGGVRDHRPVRGRRRIPAGHRPCSRLRALPHRRDGPPRRAGGADARLHRGARGPAVIRPSSASSAAR
jgi:hypothetical protein